MQVCACKRPKKRDLSEHILEGPAEGLLIGLIEATLSVWLRYCCVQKISQSQSLCRAEI